MPDTTVPTAWLHRLNAAGWLAAADNELRLADDAFLRRAVRPGVTHARRAAGMALNAILIGHENPAWGRSYMEHVVALAGDDAAPAAVREAVRLLRETPPVAPALVSPARPDRRAVDAARLVVEWARAECQPSVNG